MVYFFSLFCVLQICVSSYFPLNFDLERPKDFQREACAIHTYLFWYMPFLMSYMLQMTKVMEKSKSIVITGHSLGGAAATLCTLWLLSFFHTKTHHHPILCITFGSPLIGNESLSRAIQRERWCGKFCHVVSNHDIMPRLLSTPLPSLSPKLHIIFRYWHLSMASPQFGKLATQLTEREKEELFYIVLAHSNTIFDLGEGSVQSQFWPFGNFFFCSEHGAICLDNAISVLKMLDLMLKTSAPNLSIEDHLNYGDHVKKVGVQYMERKNLNSLCLPNSSYEAGLALALESAGIPFQVISLKNFP